MALAYQLFQRRCGELLDGTVSTHDTSASCVIQAVLQFIFRLRRIERQPTPSKTCVWHKLLLLPAPFALALARDLKKSASSKLTLGSRSL